MMKMTRARLYSFKLAALQSHPLIKANVKELAKSVQKHSGESDADYWRRLQEEARKGPVFDAYIISQIENFPERLLPNSKAPFVLWLANQIKKDSASIEKEIFNPSNYEIWSNIRDFINSTSWKEYRDFDELSEASEAWHRELSDKPVEKIQIFDDPIVYKFSDGHTIVKVKPQNLHLEGEAMSHCVGGYCRDVEVGSTNVYSLRSPESVPLATIEITDENNVTQIKGPGNKTPSKKNRSYIVEWLDSMHQDEKLYYSKDYTDILSREQVLNWLKTNYKDLKNKWQTENWRIALENMTPDKELEDLLVLLSEQPDLKQMVAQIQHTPANTLHKLFDESKKSLIRKHDIQLALSKNKKVPKEILNELAESFSTLVIEHIASRDSIDSELLDKILERFENNSAIVFKVASNPQISNDSLELLSESSSEHILFGVAKNPKLTPDIMEKIFKNNLTITPLLEQLIIHQNINEKLFKTVTNHLENRWTQTSKNTFLDTISSAKSLDIAKRPFLSKYIIENGNARARKQLAVRGDIHAEILDILSNDISDEVKSAVAGNLNTPINTLQKLKNDTNHAVSSTAENTLKSKV